MISSRKLIQLQSMKFYLMKDVTVETSAPKNFKEWFVQRRRWVVGGLQSFFSKKRTMVKNVPWAYSSLLVYYPIPISSISWFLFFSLFAWKITFPGVILASLLSTAFMMTLLWKILKWDISILSAISYLVFYGPIWSLFTVYMVLTLPFFDNKLEDWVV